MRIARERPANPNVLLYHVEERLTDEVVEYLEVGNGPPSGSHRPPASWRRGLAAAAALEGVRRLTVTPYKVRLEKVDGADWDHLVPHTDRVVTEALGGDGVAEVPASDLHRDFSWPGAPFAGRAVFEGRRHAAATPLADALFRHAGVAEVILEGEAVTVRRSPLRPWDALAPEVEGTLAGRVPGHAGPAWGCADEVAPLRRVLLRHLEDARAGSGPGWRNLGWEGAPDPDAGAREVGGLVDLLQARGVEIEWLATRGAVGLDSIFVRDPLIFTPRGVILGSMGKEGRRREPALAGRRLGELGVPVLGSIEAPGHVEGGDAVWFDAGTLAVGRGYRTDDAGIRQLADLLADTVDELVVVPLPHWNGPGEVMHLMSLISPLDHDLALVHSRLLPVPFREWLLARGIELVEVAADEFDGLAGNALALGPRECVVVDGYPETRRRLEAAGVRVHALAGDEICRKGAGGPTCLTRPLQRGVLPAEPGGAPR